MSGIAGITRAGTGATVSSAEIEAGAIVDSDINASAAIATSKLGFTPTAYTQTYSTAAATHANPTAAAVTNSTGVSPDTTIANVPDPADTPVTADNLRDDLVANVLPPIEGGLSDLADQHNKVVADLANVKQVLNQIVDNLQANSLAT